VGFELTTLVNPTTIQSRPRRPLKQKKLNIEKCQISLIHYLFYYAVKMTQKKKTITLICEGPSWS
jgi:hypothetical protein